MKRKKNRLKKYKNITLPVVQLPAVRYNVKYLSGFKGNCFLLKIRLFPQANQSAPKLLESPGIYIREYDSYTYYDNRRIGECSRNSPFHKNNGARGPLFLRNGEIRGHSPT